MDAASLLVLQDLCKYYGKHAVLSAVQLKIDRGETIILRGNNGSGKSTLLNIIAGLVAPTSGVRTVRDSQLVIGYMPDHLPKLKMTSNEYLFHMGQIAGLPAAKLKARVRELHERFGLEELATPMVYFSKGMLQKVNLMQAMLRMPDLLVLDEPLSGLDVESMNHLVMALKHLADQGTAIVAAVHEPYLGRQLGGHTYWIRQGRLVQEDKGEPLIQEAYYELDCELRASAHHALMNQFAGVDWMTRDGGYQYKLAESVHRGFLMQLLQNGGIIRSLKRKEDHACTP
ncbi:ATP-binding cassette domain-containing protein [Paenibacillus guangzhouensis]|uniref:ATP-binding cassette domain-containing protein n=1 Tax=Paenibacillus guangzhouensis TaxID=1473112 RepID=UPI0012677CF4|nr:ABC transporter ATP-binding protein [Paenibacillus guangzhouensis]